MAAVLAALTDLRTSADQPHQPVSPPHNPRLLLGRSEGLAVSEVVRHGGGPTLALGQPAGQAFLLALAFLQLYVYNKCR